ncbi:hypothetical protein REPUB_Repub07fG0001200 [Reevesia pubescens]
MDVRKELKRGLTVIDGLTNERMLAKLKYERLPNFCYHCGMLSHVDKECEKFGENNDTSVKPYGAQPKHGFPNVDAEVDNCHNVQGHEEKKNKAVVVGNCPMVEALLQDHIGGSAISEVVNVEKVFPLSDVTGVGAIDMEIVSGNNIYKKT